MQFSEFLEAFVDKLIHQEEKQIAIDFLVGYFIHKNELEGDSPTLITVEEWQKITNLWQSNDMDNHALALGLIQGFQLPYEELLLRLKEVFEDKIHTIHRLCGNFNSSLDRHADELEMLEEARYMREKVIRNLKELISSTTDPKEKKKLEEELERSLNPEPFPFQISENEKKSLPERDLIHLIELICYFVSESYPVTGFDCKQYIEQVMALRDYCEEIMKMYKMLFSEFLHLFLDKLAQSEEGEEAIDFLVGYFIQKNKLAGNSSRIISKEKWERIAQLLQSGHIGDHILALVFIKELGLCQEELRKRLVMRINSMICRR